MPFADATTETLHAVRANLLAGLDRVAASLDAGTFHTARKNGAAPPSQAGQTTLALLHQLNAELERRKVRDSNQASSVAQNPQLRVSHQRT